MGAADAKTSFWMACASSFLALVLLLIVYAGLFHTDLHRFMKRADFVANFVGFLGFAWSGVAIWIGREKEWSGGTMGLLWFAGLLAGFVFSAGFNWDYFGLPQ